MWTNWAAPAEPLFADVGICFRPKFDPPGNSLLSCYRSILEQLACFGIGLTGFSIFLSDLSRLVLVVAIVRTTRCHAVPPAS